MAMEDEEILKELIRFILRYTSVDEKFVIPSARIEEDLKLWGDEAIEFIVEFAKHFNIDVSHFMAAEYFTSEGSFYFFTKHLCKHKKRELRVSHLYNAIKKGILNETSINEIQI